MTDEAKALVERLRGDWPEILVEKHWMMDSDAIDKQREEAAGLIETQAREIERLTLTVRKLQGNQAAFESEIERLRVECEFIASVTASPLINPLEVGFRHSPLTQRERETRYMEACAIAYQSARAALAGDSHD